MIQKKVDKRGRVSRRTMEEDNSEKSVLEVLEEGKREVFIPSSKFRIEFHFPN